MTSASYQAGINACCLPSACLIACLQSSRCCSKVSLPHQIHVATSNCRRDWCLFSCIFLASPTFIGTAHSPPGLVLYLPLKPSLQCPLPVVVPAGDEGLHLGSQVQPGARDHQDPRTPRHSTSPTPRRASDNVEGDAATPAAAAASSPFTARFHAPAGIEVDIDLLLAAVTQGLVGGGWGDRGHGLKQDGRPSCMS